MLTQQDIVNKVYQYYIVEGNPPGWDTAMRDCTYFGDHGEKCAISINLPDTIRAEDMPIGRIGGILDGENDTNSFLFSTKLKEYWEPNVYERPNNGNKYSFIEDVQNAHDSSASNAIQNDPDEEDYDESEDSFIGLLEHEIKHLCNRYALAYPGGN